MEVARVSGVVGEDAMKEQMSFGVAAALTAGLRGFDQMCPRVAHCLDSTFVVYV